MANPLKDSPIHLKIVYICSPLQNRAAPFLTLRWMPNLEKRPGQNLDGRPSGAVSNGGASSSNVEG